MQLQLEGWEDGAPVRALLAAPDRAQTHAADRATLLLPGAPRPIVLHQRPATVDRLCTAVWDGGLALSEWAWGEVRARAAAAAAAGRPPPTLVELGAGVGAPSLTAALAGGRVIATEAAAGVVGLRGQAACNWLAGTPPPAASPCAGTGTVTVLPLTWGGAAWRREAAAVRAAVGGGAEDAAAAPDLLLAADVVYPLPPSSLHARPVAADVVSALASLAGPATTAVVAFEARPAGVPGPDELRRELLAAARDSFASVRRREGVGGFAFAGAGHVELYELSGVRREA